MREGSEYNTTTYGDSDHNVCQCCKEKMYSLGVLRAKKRVVVLHGPTVSSNPFPNLRYKICMASSTDTEPLSSLSFIKNSTTLNSRRGSYPKDMLLHSSHEA